KPSRVDTLLAITPKHIRIFSGSLAGKSALNCDCATTRFLVSWTCRQSGFARPLGCEILGLFRRPANSATARSCGRCFPGIGRRKGREMDGRGGWERNRKKNERPRVVGEEDKLKCQKASSDMVRLDELVACYK